MYSDGFDMYLTGGKISVEQAHVFKIGRSMTPVVTLPYIVIDGSLQTSSANLTNMFQFR